MQVFFNFLKIINFFLFFNKDVGKSSMLLYFIDKRFNSEYGQSISEINVFLDPTIGVEFGSKLFKLSEN